MRIDVEHAMLAVFGLLALISAPFWIYSEYKEWRFRRARRWYREMRAQTPAHDERDTLQRFFNEIGNKR